MSFRGNCYNISDMKNESSFKNYTPNYKSKERFLLLLMSFELAAPSGYFRPTCFYSERLYKLWHGWHTGVISTHFAFAKHPRLLFVCVLLCNCGLKTRQNEIKNKEHTFHYDKFVQFSWRLSEEPSTAVYRFFSFYIFVFISFILLAYFLAPKSKWKIIFEKAFQIPHSGKSQRRESKLIAIITWQKRSKNEFRKL